MSKKTSKKKATKKATSKKSSSQGQDNDVVAALQQLEEAWAETEEAGFSELPDGRYQVRIDKAALGHSESSGRFQCSWGFTVVSGDHRGRKMFSHDGLETDQNRSFFRGSLARLGVEWPSSATQLPAVLESILNTFCEIRVTTKGEFQNVRFIKALDDSDVEGDLENLDSVDDEAEEGLAVDTRVSVLFDGDAYEGAVKSGPDEDGSYLIAFEDGTESTHTLDEITVVNSDDSEAESSGWEIGTRVVADYDGDIYAGAISAVDEANGTAVVDFDDGSSDELSLSDLAEEPEESEEEVGEAEETTTVEGVSVSFDDSGLSAAGEKAIGALAESMEYDPNDYELWTDLLVDMAEYLGISGSFDKMADLLKACQTAAKKAS